MVLEVEATWAGTAMNPVTYDAVELRRADAGLFAGTGLAGLGARGGIILHGTLSGMVTMNDTAVTVEPFAAVLPGATGDSGVYRTALPAAHTESLVARDATYSRIDRVVMRMLDADVIGSHTGRRARLEVLPGTPAAVPAVPTMPSMAIEVARLTVPPTGSVTVSRLFAQYACAPGGIWPVPTAARLGTSAAPGQEAYVLDTERKVRWNGSAWRPCEPVAGVASSITTNANGAFTLTHGLGYVPSVVHVEPNNSQYKAAPDITTYDVNTCLVYVRRMLDGALVTGTLVSPLTFVAYP